MIDDNKLISVRNSNNGKTGYVIPERHLDRTWNVGETKKIPFEELKAFSYMPGGIYTLENLLVIEDEEAIKELLNKEVEPEYNYDEQKIREVLFNGSMDELEDFLNFAPLGRIEILKTLAINEEVPDTRKRDLISKKTGLNINTAIDINHVMNDGEEEKAEEAPKRKVAITKEETKERKAAVPQHKVVTK